MSIFVRLIEAQTASGPVLYAASPFHSAEASDQYGATIQRSGAGIDHGAAEMVDAVDLLEASFCGTEDVYDLNAA